MDKICTTIEQSKKLLELGIDKNTADMFWKLVYDNKRRCVPISPFYKIYNDVLYVRQWTEPAWSFSVLMELMPELKNYGYPALVKTSIGIRGDGSPITMYFVSYDDGLDPFNTEKYSNPIDAAFEMVCWLLENKKI